jgi:hypothetical protein
VKIIPAASRLFVRWWSADHFDDIKVSFRSALP